MIGRHALQRLVERRVLTTRVSVWLLWGLAVCLLASCPAVFSDPGMWPYLLDPELLALVVVMGAVYTRMELGVLLLRARLWWMRRRRRPDTGSGL